MLKLIFSEKYNLIYTSRESVKMSASPENLLALIKAVLKDNKADTRKAVAMHLHGLGKAAKDFTPWELFAAKVIGSSDAEVAAIYDQVSRVSFRAFVVQNRGEALRLAMADDPEGFHNNPEFSKLFDITLKGVVLKV